MKEFYKCDECEKILEKKDVFILYEGNCMYRGLNPIFFCKKHWELFVKEVQDE